MLSMGVRELGENQGSLDGKGPSCNRVQREFDSRSVELYFCFALLFSASKTNITR